MPPPHAPAFLPATPLAHRAPAVPSPPARTTTPAAAPATAPRSRRLPTMVTQKPPPTSPPPQQDLESGAQYLSPLALEKARAGTKFEKIKLKNDGSHVWTEIHELSKLLREGKTKWEDLAVDDIDTRFKWAGLFHRRKRTPGRFMMRLKVPNGILSASQLRYLASVLYPYGDDGCADITTRMNVQLRGVVLDDVSDICNGLYDIGLTSFMSGMDNVRNMVGSPIAGIDPLELIDTRALCTDINDMITDFRKGNPKLSNLPRKFNICVSGSRDDFAHTHINDIGLQPVPHDKTGVMGFNVVIGGFFSIKRNAEALPMDVWLPPEDVVRFCETVLLWFRDNGDRKNRQASRLMYMVDQLGMAGFRDVIEAQFGAPFETAMTGPPEFAEPVPRRNVLGVHAQKQPGLSWVCACVPVGRLQTHELDELADLAEKYSGGELRMTVEQNVLFPNVPNEKVDALKSETLLRERFLVEPAGITANLVSCTGSQFCGVAMIETKQRAVELARRLDETLVVPREVRLHMTGCPNSCAQAQVADIGLMGAPAKKDGKGVEGVRIFIGGRIGEEARLAEEITKKAVPADVDDLLPVMTDLLIERFGATKREAV